MSARRVSSDKGCAIRKATIRPLEGADLIRPAANHAGGIAKIPIARSDASCRNPRRPFDWLDGAFSAGDLMMVSVLLRLKPSGLLGEHPDLSAYVARGEARPAFRRAFDAQLAVFRVASSG
jgi:hypothetical protein